MIGWFWDALPLHGEAIFALLGPVMKDDPIVAAESQDTWETVFLPAPDAGSHRAADDSTSACRVGNLSGRRRRLKLPAHSLWRPTMFALSYLPLAALDEFRPGFTIDHPIASTDEAAAAKSPEAHEQVVNLDIGQTDTSSHERSGG